MNPLHTIADAADSLRSGAVTSVELTERAIAVADRFDGELGVFLSRFPDQALACAAVADAELAAGHDRGPPHGIPLGIKDIITTTEGPTTAQSLVHDPEWNRADAAPATPAADRRAAERRPAQGSLFRGVS
jgi:aspartyl-tRNA(Asn)/glutamyl-tRNA(Gln) amidotransferase subunit A